MQVAPTEYNKRCTAYLHEKRCVRALTEELRNFIILHRVFCMLKGNAEGIFWVKTLSILHFKTELSYLKQRLKCQNNPILRRHKHTLPTGEWGPLALKCCCKHFQSLSLHNSGWGERQTEKNF